MSYLLAIETATDVCSVAVMREESIISEITMDRPRKHAEQLSLMCQDAFRLAGIQPKELGAVGVSMGPGSYTGLRIGVSSAKALALSASSKLIGVPTLQAQAFAVLPFAQPGDLVLSALDSRRDEVYAWLGRVEDGGGLKEETSTRACSKSELPSFFDGSEPETCWLVGNGSKKSSNELQQHNHLNLSTLSEMYPVPSARWVAQLASDRWRSGHTEDLASFEPYYLKEFKARPSTTSIFDRLPS